MTSGSLWNYYSDKVNDNANGNNAAGNKINNKKAITTKYLNIRQNGSTANNNNTLNAEVIVPLTYFSNF